VVNFAERLMIAALPAEHPRDPASGSADHEIKFVVPSSVAGALRAWVGGVCRLDVRHPPARVTTVYFDTPDLRLLSEKIDSDYLKTKVRVRWYGTVDSGASSVFAEVKHRIGSHRVKVRVTLDVSAADVVRWPLCDRRWPGLLATLRAQVPTLPSQLAPVLCLTYTRHRFLDPALAARITIDSDIRAIGVNVAMVAGQVPVGIDDVVFEYKSRSFDLPPHQGPIVRYGARRMSFSKYLACYQAVTRLVL
jgi:hypothetical protein